MADMSKFEIAKDILASFGFEQPNKFAMRYVKGNTEVHLLCGSAGGFSYVIYIDGYADLQGRSPLKLREWLYKRY